MPPRASRGAPPRAGADTPGLDCFSYTTYTIIAAHAMSLNVTLVCNNTKYFARVKGLKTVNWLHAAG